MLAINKSCFNYILSSMAYAIFKENIKCKFEKRYKNTRLKTKIKSNVNWCLNYLIEDKNDSKENVLLKRMINQLN